jgi:peroxiredoxin
MNRMLRLSLSAAALLLSATAVAHADGIALGDVAPKSDVKLKNVDGKETSIAAVRGAKGTLVVFSCNACPWAKAWESRIVELGNSYSKKGIGVIVINSNDPAVNAEDGFDVMVQRAKDRKMTYPYAVDGTSEIARAFGATRTPEAFLFDRDGKLVYHGTVDDNAKEPQKVEKRWLKDALDAAIAGKPVPVAETKALGCSIKFRGGSAS